MQQLKEFQLSKTTVACPACEAVFQTPQLTGVPPITASTPVETDLHRILPNGAIRAALIAACQNCSYTWWITAFRQEGRRPAAAPPADEYSLERHQYPRKFASAYLIGKLRHTSPRELALVLLNGAWCARESGYAHQHWLALAARELEAALADKNWDHGRGYYSYLMAEICRQMEDFARALHYFDQAADRSPLPPELILRQKVQATAADASPTRLPSYLVQRIYCPRHPALRRASGGNRD